MTQHTQTVLKLTTLAVLIWILLSGCLTTQKAINKLDQDSVASAQYCMVRYPVKESIRYLPGRITERSEILHIDGTIGRIPQGTNIDSLLRRLSEEGVPSVVSTVQHIRDTVEISQVDSARVVYYKSLYERSVKKVLEIRGELERVKAKLSKKSRSSTIKSVLIIALLGFLFRKRISGIWTILKKVL